MSMTWVTQSQRKVPNPDRLRGKLERAVLNSRDSKGAFRLPEINGVLRDEVGAWTEGWCWGNIDGGPVQRWCCVQHSFLQGKPGEEPARTVDLILAGLEDWDTTLRDCESLFGRLVIKEPVDIDIAVLELVKFAVEATDASDAWYGFCEDVLSWYLQHLGIAEGRAQGYARKAINGQFESWSGPSEEVLEKVAESFRELVWRALPG